MRQGTIHDEADEATNPRRRAFADRVVFECVECGDTISWPVSPEPRRKRGKPDTPVPDEGRYRETTRRDGTRIFLMHHTAARLEGWVGVKQARTCAEGHYIGNHRIAPHEPPWFLEVLVTAVSERPARASERD